MYINHLQAVWLDSISLEIIYRGLYHFYVAHQKGKPIDPIKYFAAPENQDFGIVKQQRKPNVKLIVAPFPDKQRGTPEFFFQPSSQIPLTTATPKKRGRFHSVSKSS
ncbi:hypothetical protein Nos7107_2116 [Nostoc sp. PCC 7107]|nr:hypothetical protein Nos7107_2116 [Nostoc sp. PCC 7107]